MALWVVTHEDEGIILYHNAIIAWRHHVIFHKT